MPSTVYLSQAARERIAAAQTTVARHVAHTTTGWCRVCGVTTPCSSLREAQETLARYGRLPRREPGATGPPRRRRNPAYPGRPDR